MLLSSAGNSSPDYFSKSPLKPSPCPNTVIFFLQYYLKPARSRKDESQRTVRKTEREKISILQDPARACLMLPGAKDGQHDHQVPSLSARISGFKESVCVCVCVCVWTHMRVHMRVLGDMNGFWVAVTCSVGFQTLQPPWLERPANQSDTGCKPSVQGHPAQYLPWTWRTQRGKDSRRESKLIYPAHYICHW